jgi:hypothetical protein
MRRVAVVLACVLVAAGLAGSAREGVAVAQTPSKAQAVLALVEAYNGSRLVWLDPATLRPLPRRSVSLPGGAWRPVFSPKGRYVAFGGPGSVGIRVVDVPRMKIVARLARGASHRRVTPLAWPERRSLLVLDEPQDAHGAPDALLAVDPVERRIVGRTVRASSAKEWGTWAPAGRELVVLSQPSEDMGVVRLVVFGPGGGILRAKDVGIVAGVLPQHGDGTVPRGRTASPALALDIAGRRAFVVDPQTVARIDLGLLEISYKQLTEPRSLASRLLSWLEPAAQAKFLSGYSRHATFLDDDALAVTGSTYDGASATPTGLQLVDATTGAVRTLEPRASGHRFTRGILLAYGATRDPATSVAAGMGLAAFSRSGERLWSALGGEAVWGVEAAGGYAYVVTPEGQFPSGVRVIDLGTGDVVRTVRGAMPYFVE